MSMPLIHALRDIACGRGRCGECGKLADMPSNCVSCDDYKRCRWEPQDAADTARKAIEAWRDSAPPEP